MLSTFKIDRVSAEPFYLQLVRWLESEITSGQYSIGDALPSETQLCRHFSLSRHTVRETLRLLQERGHIRIIQRRGAFVASPPARSWKLQLAEGFSEAETRFNKRVVDTDVLRVALEALPVAASSALNLEPGSTGVVVERLRRLDGELALYGMNYLIPNLAPVIGNGDILRGGASLNRVLKQAGWNVHGARRSIAAVSASKALADLLEIRRGSPLILINSVSWDAEGRHFDYYSSWLRSEQVPVEIEVEVARSSD